MEAYDETTYGDRIADIYDEFYPGYQEPALDLLQVLARGGRVLELGIGTGRLALPLHQRGLQVTGIDASEAMIQKLRDKPGSDGIEVVRGSFVDIDIDARFELIFVVFNTFFGLQTQDEQVRCFQSVADHLTPDGLFLIEAFVPDLGRFEDGQTVRAIHVGDGEVRLEVSRHGALEQQVTSQQVLLSEEGLRFIPVKVRYAWPSELDLMARLAGLRLKHRWESWDRRRFSEQSKTHISVYGRA